MKLHQLLICDGADMHLMRSALFSCFAYVHCMFVILDVEQNMTISQWQEHYLPDHVGLSTAIRFCMQTDLRKY